MHELTTTQRASYLQALLQRYDTLSLPLGSGLSFSLIQVFQPLCLRQGYGDVPEQPVDEEDSREASIEDNERDGAEESTAFRQVLAENGIDALEQSPRGRLVILGGPGSGKTTVLKHLLCHHALLALEDPGAPLPLLLSLPDLARTDQDLPSFLARYAADLGLAADDGQAL